VHCKQEITIKRKPLVFLVRLGTLQREITFKSKLAEVLIYQRQTLAFSFITPPPSERNAPPSFAAVGYLHSVSESKQAKLCAVATAVVI
jgi:hypothetical protein